MPSSARARREGAGLAPASRRARLVPAALGLLLLARPAAAGRPPCPGDCDGDGRVAVAELVLGVRIALGVENPAACAAIDADGDGVTGVGDLVAAVRAAIEGCASPTQPPTPTPTPTPAVAPFTHLRAAGTTHLGPLIGYGKDMPLSAAEPGLQRIEAGGDVVHGTDIGIPVTVRHAGKAIVFFFFGDTDPLDPAALVRGEVRKAEADPQRLPPFVAAKGVVQGDSLAWADDENPDDGIQLGDLYRNVQPAGTDPVCAFVDGDGIRPLFVPGVHDDDRYHFLPDIPGDACIGAASYNTPTGAFAVDEVLFMVTGIQNHFARADLPAWSFLSASTDGGLTWQLLNDGEPLSHTSAGPGGKFIHAEAVILEVGALSDPDRSAPCPVPAPPTGTDGRVVLLFGTGTWLHTGLYLAAAWAGDLLEAAGKPSEPLPLAYWAGPERCWTARQEEAVPVVDATAARHYTHLEAPCGYRIWEGTGGLDYPSVIRLRTTAGGRQVDRLLLASNPKYFVCEDDGSADVCCGGTPDPSDPGICIPPPDGQPTRPLRDIGLGLVLLSGDPHRPWDWAQVTDEAGSRLAFAPVPAPASGPPGSDDGGPACKSRWPRGSTLGGYAPHLIGRYTRARADGGIDLYVLSSMWDPTRYNVNVFRTTLYDAP